MSRSVRHYYQKQKKGAFSFWSNELELDGCLCDVLKSLNHLANTDLELLKQSTRRCVLRMSQFSVDHYSVVIKAFPLSKIEERIKYKKYGLAEAIIIFVPNSMSCRFLLVMHISNTTAWAWSNAMESFLKICAIISRWMISCRNLLSSDCPF